jgi:hypothetical protein
MAIIKRYNSCGTESALLICSYFLSGPMYKLVHPSVMDRYPCMLLCPRYAFYGHRMYTFGVHKTTPFVYSFHKWLYSSLLGSGRFLSFVILYTEGLLGRGISP